MILKIVAIAMLLVSGAPGLAIQHGPGDLTYIALGDSIAAGIGSSLPRERSYPAILDNLLSAHLDVPVRIVNLARPGESASSFLSSGQSDDFRNAIEESRMSGARVEAITVTLGGNDVLDQLDTDDAARASALEAFQESMPAALQTIREIAGNETAVYTSTIYDPTGGDPTIQHSDSWWIEQFNEVIREASSAEDIMLVDLAVSLGTDAVELTRYPVDVHPTNAGHARIAAEFWRATEVDQQAPQLTVSSASAFRRFTPTLRFTVSPDTDLNSISIQVSDDRAVVYPPVEVSDFEFALLVDASELEPGSLEVTLRAADVAGNQAETTINLTFEVGP